MSKQEAVESKSVAKTIDTKPAPPQYPLMPAQESGVLIPKTLEDQYRLARYYWSSGLMPSGLDTTEKVLVALQLCFEMGLPPMSSIGNIAVINGVPCIFGQLPMALAMKSGKLLSVKEFWFDQKGNEVSERAPIETIAGATCIVTRHGFDAHARSFSIEDAKLAKLWGKVGQSGKPTPWVLYPKRMLQMRARSWALKDRFGDALMGIPIAEYDFDAVIEGGRVIETHVTIPPKRDVSQELNAIYHEKETTKEQGSSK